MLPTSSHNREKVRSMSPSSMRVYCRPFKRSKAVRIKSNNLELLPDSLRNSIIALKLKPVDSLATEQIEDGAELDLFEQIRRGVKLKPIDSKRGTRKGRDSLDKGYPTRECVSHKNIEDGRHNDESTESAMLFRVLRNRYLAVQLTDDDDSDVSSIDSGGDPSRGVINYDAHCDNLSHVGRESQMIERRFVLSSLNGSLNGLLEQFAQLNSNCEQLDCATMELINDLIVKL